VKHHGKSSFGVYLPDLEQKRPSDQPPEMVKLRLIKKEGCAAPLPPRMVCNRSSKNRACRSLVAVRMVEREPFTPCSGKPELPLVEVTNKAPRVRSMRRARDAEAAVWVKKRRSKRADLAISAVPYTETRLVPRGRELIVA
jgi:hypothetical protein